MSSPSDEFKKQVIILAFMIAGTVVSVAMMDPDFIRTTKMRGYRDFGRACDRGSRKLTLLANESYERYYREAL